MQSTGHFIALSMEDLLLNKNDVTMNSTRVFRNLQSKFGQTFILANKVECIICNDMNAKSMSVYDIINKWMNNFTNLRKEISNHDNDLRIHSHVVNISFILTEIYVDEGMFVWYYIIPISIYHTIRYIYLCTQMPMMR